MTFAHSYAYGIATGGNNTVFNPHPGAILRFFQEMGPGRPEGDAVVGSVYCAVGNSYVLAAVYVNPITVECMIVLPAGMHIAPGDSHLVAVQEETAPVGRIGQLYILNSDIVTVHEPYHLGRTCGDKRFIGIWRPIGIQQKRIRIAVNPALSAEGHIAYTNSKDEMASADVISPAYLGLVLGAAVGRAIILYVGAAFDNSTLVKMELNIAPKPYGAAEICPFWHRH